MTASEAKLEELLQKQLLEFKETNLTTEDLIPYQERSLEQSKHAPIDHEPKWDTRELLKLALLALEGYSNWEIADSFSFYRKADELVTPGLIAVLISTRFSEKLKNLRKVAVHIHNVDALLAPQDPDLESKLSAIEKKFNFPRTKFFVSTSLGMMKETAPKQTHRSVYSPDVLISILYQRVINKQNLDQLREHAEMLLHREVTTQDVTGALSRSITPEAREVFGFKPEKGPRKPRPSRRKADVAARKAAQERK